MEKSHYSEFKFYINLNQSYERLKIEWGDGEGVIKSGEIDLSRTEIIKDCKYFQWCFK